MLDVQLNLSQKIPAKYEEADFNDLLYHFYSKDKSLLKSKLKTLLIGQEDEMYEQLKLQWEVKLTNESLSFHNEGTDLVINCQTEKVYTEGLKSLEQMKNIKKFKVHFYPNHFVEAKLKDYEFDISGKAKALQN